MKSSFIIFILAIILLIPLSLINSGLQSFYQYKNSARPTIEINLDLIHFFIKQNIKKIINKPTIHKLTEETNIPSFWLYTDDKDVDQLNSDLPRSGKTLFASGYLKTSLSDSSKKVKFRYRGGLPLHWLYDKKSFRIKLNEYDNFKGDQQFNLVTPSTKYTIVDSIAYDISRKKGLITPDYFPAKVFVNNKYNGVHYYLSQADESLVRRQHRMPGSIYVGDNQYNSEEDGVSSEIFVDQKTLLPALWFDPLIWDKKAARNSESKTDRSDIKKFIRIANQTDPLLFYNQFNQYYDTKKYFIYFAIDTYFGSHHHDYFHNHKLYFDPYKGKFEPIEWDVRFWNSTFKIKDYSGYPLLEQIQKNPLLEHQRDIVTYDLLKEYSLDKIKGIIKTKYTEVNDEMLSDPYKRSQSSDYYIFSMDKSLLLTNKDYISATNDLVDIAESRYKYLQTLYNSSEIMAKINKINANQSKLILSVNKNSAVSINWQLLLKKGLTIIPFFEEKKLNGKLYELLYPGRQRHAVINLDKGIKTLGKDQAFASPLHYTYFITGTSHTHLKKIINSLQATNAITGKDIKIKVVDKLPSDEKTISVHPWKFDRFKKEDKIINLSGVVNINEDKIYAPNETVIIEPGTVFSIAPEKSLFFYGRVSALGTENSPIHFQRRVDDKAWGSVVIQGQGTSGSVLNYIKLSGGSITTRQLIHYPGQFNIHDVTNFKLNNCYISNNSVGDDALHIAYSSGTISNCTLENTAMDALDIDISTVEVKGSTFINSGNDGIDVMNSKVIIEDNHFIGSRDKCLSIGEGTRAKIKNNSLENCQIGIAVKDSSVAELHNVRFITKANPSITLYQKNTRYSKGGTISGDSIYGISSQDIEIGTNSSVHISDGAFKPLTQAVQ